jgi:hypothetical protein
LLSLLHETEEVDEDHPVMPEDKAILFSNGPQSNLAIAALLKDDPHVVDPDYRIDMTEVDINDLCSIMKLCDVGSFLGQGQRFNMLRMPGTNPEYYNRAMTPAEFAVFYRAVTMVYVGSRDSRQRHKFLVQQPTFPKIQARVRVARMLRDAGMSYNPSIVRHNLAAVLAREHHADRLIPLDPEEARTPTQTLTVPEAIETVLGEFEWSDPRRAWTAAVGSRNAFLRYATRAAITDDDD